MAAQLGIPVLLVALVGAVATPIATTTGEQLQANLPANPLLQVHADLGSMLTPYAVAFAVLVAAAVLVELSTARVAVSAGSHAATPPTPGRSRLAGVLAALAALAGIWVTYLVVRIGHAGATVVWQGIGQ
ncbi:hypothetical protein BJF78_18200 [Pseudonocardia sp. CNS-139]|nr:hypothetical protein BJF78_18200 [Pseudonocardia sp. CNS-139]